MANPKKSFELDAVEVQWLRVSLSTQISVLRRKLNAEVPGSDIRAIRAKEIEAVAALQAKF